MNKKANTVFFILGATVLNIVTMLIILFLGIFLIGRFLSESAQESVGQFLFILVFLVAIAGSFFSYNRLIKYISNKIDMDKYFHPIFKPRGGGKKPE
jgi:hypothetical protein